MDQALGFVLGVCASLLAVYLLTRIRPSIAVAPRLAYDSQKRHLRIKVINRGRRQVSDCRVTLTLNERQMEGDRLRMKIQHRLPLARKQLFALGPKTEFGRPWTIYPAFVFRATVGNPEILTGLGSAGDSERRLVFTLAARDAMSGSEIVLRTTYTHEDIQEGIYRTGDSFDIVPACGNEGEIEPVEGFHEA